MVEHQDGPLSRLSVAEEDPCVHSARDDVLDLAVELSPQAVLDLPRDRDPLEGEPINRPHAGLGSGAALVLHHKVDPISPGRVEPGDVVGRRPGLREDDVGPGQEGTTRLTLSHTQRKARCGDRAEDRPPHLVPAVVGERVRKAKHAQHH
jgi:hypothetical protein